MRRYCAFWAVYGATLVYRLYVLMASGRTFEESFAFVLQSLMETVFVLFVLAAMIREAVGSRATTDRLISETVANNHGVTWAMIDDLTGQVKVLTAGITGEYEAIARWLLDNETEDKTRELQAVDRHAEIIGELLAINGHTGSLDRRLGKLEADAHDHGMTLEEIQQVRREMGVTKPLPPLGMRLGETFGQPGGKPLEELGETVLPDRSAEMADLLAQYDEKVANAKRSATPAEIMHAAHPDRLPVTDDDGMGEPA